MANIKDSQKAPLHPAQMRILAHMLTLKQARFRDIKAVVPELTTKHTTYHIKKLGSLGLIEKRADKTYHLTDKGKKFVADIDIFAQQNKKVEYAKRTAILRAVKKEGDTYKWLFFKRLKHPFYGYVGFPAGKIIKGESPVQTAIREFYEETGLIMKAWELIKIEHDLVYSAQGDLEFDIYYYAFNIYDFEGTLRAKSEEGEYFWATYEEFKNMKHFPDMFKGQDKPHHWSQATKHLERYLKLKAQGKWRNKPENSEGIQEFPVTYIEWPYTVEEY